MTTSQNFRVLDGIVTAGFIGLAGFMWNLSGDLSQMATTINNINDTMIEVKADVKDLGNRITKAEVAIASIDAEVKHKATRADLLELINGKK